MEKVKTLEDQIIRTPPQSIDVEQIVLGSLLLDEEAVSIAIEGSSVLAGRSAEGPPPIKPGEGVGQYL